MHQRLYRYLDPTSLQRKTLQASLDAAELTLTWQLASELWFLKQHLRNYAKESHYKVAPDLPRLEPSVPGNLHTLPWSYSCRF